MEKPIIFNTEMVKAILAGRKTQTRRMAEDLLPVRNSSGKIVGRTSLAHEVENGFINDYAPYPVGTKLWVKETFIHIDDENDSYDGMGSTTYYRADQGHKDELEIQRMGLKWTPSIHMPRWASRIMLEVVSVKCERVQAISEADALAEGVGVFDEVINHPPLYLDYVLDEYWLRTAAESFKTLFISIYGIEEMAKNPWVWVYEFKVIEVKK